MLRVILTIGFFQALSLALSLIRLKTIAIFAGPEGLGVVSLVDQAVLFVMHLSVVSIPFAVLPFLSRSHREGFETFAQSYRSLLVLLGALTVTGTGVALGTVFAGLWSAELFQYKELLIPGLMTIPAVAVRSFTLNVLAAAGRSRESAARGVLNAALLLAAAGAGVFAGGLPGLYWATLLAGIFFAMHMLAYVKRRLGLSIVAGWRDVASELRREPDLVPFCLSFYFVAFSQPLAWLIARHSVLEQFGAAQAGWLQALTGVAMGLTVALGPATILHFQPMMSRTAEKKEAFGLATEFQRKITLVLAILTLPMVLFPRSVLLALYSKAFVQAAGHLFLFVLAETILILAGVLQAMLLGLGDRRVYVAIFVMGHATLGGLSWLLVETHGISGVAVASLAASSLMFVLALTRLWTSHGFRPDGRVTGFFLFMVSTLAAAGALSAASVEETWQSALLKLLVLVSFGVVAAFFQDPEDRLALYRRLGAVRLRNS